MLKFFGVSVLSGAVWLAAETLRDSTAPTDVYFYLDVNEPTRGERLAGDGGGRRLVSVFGIRVVWYKYT
jgi:hypothetical protein